MAPNWEEHSFEVPRQCRYLLHAPESLDAGTVLVLALHGYGQTPEQMLRLTRGLVGDDKPIAAMAGPNEYFLDPNPASSQVGYNWGTRNHWPEAIRMHAAMVQTVLAELGQRYSIAPSRTLLLGYSQPVGLNYRFVGTHPAAVGALLAICGGVPKDWEQPEAYQNVSIPILHIARDQDEFFPAEVSSGFKQRLEAHATDVTFHMMEGSHRFPSKARGIVCPWLSRVFS